MIIILPFRTITLDDRDNLAPILEALPYGMCDHNFSTLFIWQYKYDTRIAIDDGVIYLVYGFTSDTPLYFAPICDDDRLPDAIDRIVADAAQRGKPFRMGMINDALRETIMAVCPDRFDYAEDRDSADYLYDAEALRTYAGKKLHAKRNFVNRFLSEHEGKYTLELVSKDNLAAVMDFNHRRCLDTREEKGLSYDAKNCALHEEACAISTALVNRDKLHLTGVCLRLEGQVIAYALGTRLNETTYLEQIEKADPSIPGAYPMITQAFARLCTEDAVLVNREEDMGIEGLRRAKLSFYPSILNMRYIATIKKD